MAVVPPTSTVITFSKCASSCKFYSRNQTRGGTRHEQSDWQLDGPCGSRRSAAGLHEHDFCAKFFGGELLLQILNVFADNWGCV